MFQPKESILYYTDTKKKIVWVIMHQGNNNQNILFIFDSYKLANQMMVQIICSTAKDPRNTFPKYDPSEGYSGSFTYINQNNVYKMISFYIEDNVESLFVEYSYVNNTSKCSIFNSFQDAKKTILDNAGLPSSAINYRYNSEIPNNSITEIFYSKNGQDNYHLVKEYPIIIDQEQRSFMNSIPKKIPPVKMMSLTQEEVYQQLINAQVKH